MGTDKGNKLYKNKDIETDVMSQKTINESISVKNIREEVKNVIEQMGIYSPRKINESDTEELSTTCDDSIVHLEIKELANNGMKPMFDSSQDSQMTTYDISEISVDVQKKTNSEEEGKIIPPSGDDSYPSTYVPIQIPNHSYSRLHPNHIRLTTPQPLTNTPRESKLVKQETCERSSRLANWLGRGNKSKKDAKCDCKNCELYTINIEQAAGDHSPPRRLVFDLLDELPKAKTKTIATNTKKNKDSKIKKSSEGIHKHFVKKTTSPLGNERIDIYYFDHGNSEYYRTTDAAPVIMTEILAERTENYTKRFWAQIFGTINIGVAFVVSFILQLIRFLLQSIIRPLVIGIIQLVSDYFIKPCFAITFNGLLQPMLIFLYNLATSIRDVCGPIADTIGYFIREFAILLKSIRLINVDNSRIIKSCKQQQREGLCIEREESCPEKQPCVEKHQPCIK